MSSPGPRGQLQRLWSAEGLALVVGVLQGLVLARTLGPDLYGVYALTVTFATLVYVVLDPRSGDVLVRYMVDLRRTDDRVGQLALIKAMVLVDMSLWLAGMVLIAVTAPIAAGLLSIDNYSGLLVVAAVGAGTAAPVFSGRAVLSVFERFDLISRRQTNAVLVRAAVVLTIAVATPTLSVVLAILSLVSLLEMALFVTSALRVSRHALGASVVGSPMSALRERRREIGHFMLTNGSTTLLASSIKQVDTLIVGAVAGPREAGLYRLAKSLATPVGAAAVPVQTMLYPRLAQAWACGDKKGFRSLARRSFRRAGLPLALLTLCTLPLLDPAIRILAGEAFAGAVIPAQGLLVGAAISFASIHQRPMLLSGGWVKQLLVFTSIASAVSVAAFIPSAELWGAGGVAWSRTGIVGVATIAMAIYLARASRDE